MKMSAGGVAVMSHIQKRMDNPTCSPFPSYANPNLVAITTLPRNSQRLTDRFFVHERAVNLSGVEEPDTCSTAVRIRVIISCLSPAEP